MHSIWFHLGFPVEPSSYYYSGNQLNNTLLGFLPSLCPSFLLLLWLGLPATWIPCTQSLSQTILLDKHKLRYPIYVRWPFPDRSSLAGAETWLPRTYLRAQGGLKEAVVRISLKEWPKVFHMLTECLVEFSHKGRSRYFLHIRSEFLFTKLFWLQMLFNLWCGYILIKPS